MIFGAIFSTAIFFTRNFQQSIEITGGAIQSLAIIIGGFWAYKKFGWERKSEIIIEFDLFLIRFLSEYRSYIDKYKKNKDLEKYREKIFPLCRKAFKKFQACRFYLPKKVQKQSLQAIWLPAIYANHGKFKDIIDSAKNIENRAQKIHNRLESMVSLG